MGKRLELLPGGHIKPQNVSMQKRNAPDGEVHVGAERGETL